MGGRGLDHRHRCGQLGRRCAMTLLDVVLFLPLLGFLLLVFSPKGNANLPRVLALGTSLVVFVISLGFAGPYMRTAVSVGYIFETIVALIGSPPPPYPIRPQRLSLWLVVVPPPLFPPR